MHQDSFLYHHCPFFLTTFMLESSQRLGKNIVPSTGNKKKISKLWISALAAKINLNDVENSVKNHTINKAV